jgi:nitroreductase
MRSTTLTNSFPPSLALVPESAWQPLIFDRAQPDDAARLDDLLGTGQVHHVYDTIAAQIHDLLRTRAPQGGLAEAELGQRTKALIGEHPLQDFGRWIYYPWSGRLVHVLPPAAFHELRLDRNRYKITPAEQARLDGYIVGIVGLSVGNAVANTLALEGACGILKLADFDDLALSNMNRLRAGIHELGLLKTVVAARQIYETNPYAQVTLFHTGLTPENIDDFLRGEPQLHAVVDECDELRMKFLLRERARAFRLPVLMETSDRGMLDVERFDQEPERPLFHGQVGDVRAKDLHSLTNDDKLRFVLAIIGARSISTRAAASLPEIKQTLSTWPQLASEVALGGASITTAIRRLALGHALPSQRRYLDIEALLSGEVRDPEQRAQPGELSLPHADCILDPRIPEWIRFIVEHGVLAPSGGNCQPWRFYFDGLRLWVIHDQQRSYNLLDQQQRAASIALGAAIENMVIAAAERGYCSNVKLFPRPSTRTVVAELTFEQVSNGVLTELTELFPLIRRRATNRRLAPRVALPAAHIAALHQASAVHGGQLHLLDDAAALAELGQIMGAGDQLRFLCRDLHRELIAELRWTSEEAQQTRDGVDMATLELTEAQRAMLQVIARPDVAAFLRELGGGAALTEIAAQSVTSASAVGLLSIAGDQPADLLCGGRAVERLWLQATALGLALHPMTAVLYMFDMVRTEAAAIFTEAERATLRALQARFYRLFPHSGTPLLLFRIAQAPAPTTRALRRPIEQVLRFGEPAPAQ